MIFDTIKNKDKYKDMPKVYEALCYLENVTVENMPEKRLDLKPDNQAFLVPKVYDTEPEETAPFEAHRLRADIHYMLEGTEGVQTADVNDPRITPNGEFRVNNDCGDFFGEPDGTYWLRPGLFALSFPGEVHRTGIMKDKPEPIKKVVYKIGM
ncbi:MAG: YhcH/YjgK/YiaL family protein [Lachnospiraceae bacterium]|nr:YhcH/YjgK/YiaL family protein [Lachnospiraceae bacterium]